MTKKTTEMTTRDFENKLKKELQDSFKQLDEVTESKSPSLAFFESMVEEKKEQQRISLVKDLTLFSVLACFIFAILIASFMRLPMAFVCIQVIGIVVIPIIIFALKRRGEMDHNDA